jgi:hypothetical protein
MSPNHLDLVPFDGPPFSAYRTSGSSSQTVSFSRDWQMATQVTSAMDERKKAPQPTERPVSAKTAAEFLQMHVRSITRMAGVGHIPAHPIGYGQRKRWLFYISELDEWLRAQVCSEISRRRQGKGGRVA